MRSSSPPVAWALLAAATLACAPRASPASATPATPVDEDDLAASHERRCEELWGRLRVGAIADVPLATRCRLASELASAAVFTLTMTRTPWVALDGDSLDALILLGSRDRVALIADTETCPQIEATRFYTGGRAEDRVAVTLRGAVDRPTPIGVWLYLPTAASERAACTATFRSPLNQGVSPLRPPTWVSPQRRAIHRPAVWSHSAPAPALVVEVTMDAAGAFTITRQAIEA